MNNFLHTSHLAGVTNIGPRQCGKSVFLNNLILNFICGFEKNYIYSPFLLQELYQKLKKYFNIFIPLKKDPKLSQPGRYRSKNWDSS